MAAMNPIENPNGEEDRPGTSASSGIDRRMRMNLPPLGAAHPGDLGQGKDLFQNIDRGEF
jgi:hypothetical protein